MDNFNAAEAAARLMALEQMQGAPGVPGMPGTPGGPVQESPTMQAERALQYLSSYPVGVAGGPIAMSAGPLAGMGAIGLGLGMASNSTSPNIRDVWADQLRMKMQGN